MVRPRPKNKIRNIQIACVAVMLVASLLFWIGTRKDQNAVEANGDVHKGSPPSATSGSELKTDSLADTSGSNTSLASISRPGDKTPSSDGTTRSASQVSGSSYQEQDNAQVIYRISEDTPRDKAGRPQGTSTSGESTVAAYLNQEIDGSKNPGTRKSSIGERLDKFSGTFTYQNAGPGATASQQVTRERKAELGVNESLDMIVRSDETFSIGNAKVSMKDILKQAYSRNTRIFEEAISDAGEIVPETIKAYGIYVVQPGDNLWNIHFNIIRDHYHTKDINVSAYADEPLETGESSGVGKLLKFSESMVIIYNLHLQKIVDNVHVLKPLSKIVVYDMEEVFSLLDEIDYQRVDSIRFDGETIWIPATQNRQQG